MQRKRNMILMCVTKSNGGAFETGTFKTSFQRRLDRHLRQIDRMLKNIAKQSISAGKVLKGKANWVTFSFPLCSCNVVEQHRVHFGRRARDDHHSNASLSFLRRS